MPEVRPAIKSTRTASYRQDSLAGSPARDYGELQNIRPMLSRTSTMDPSPSHRRDTSPMAPPRPIRMPSDSLTIRTTRGQLRSVDPTINEHDVFGDDSTFYASSSPDHSFGARSVSPATSHGSSSAAFPITASKKPPPPIPAKRRPPPPPPAKRIIPT